VLASGLVMFHMKDDVKILAVSAASAFSVVVGALLLARWILTPLERLRGASNRIAAGELSARAPVHGPRELADVGRSFNEMAAGIEELFDARRQLVAWASHDLRTPLASLRAMFEALEDGLATPEEYLPSIGEQVQHLSKLVDDLFELATIDAGALTLEPHDASFRSLVDSCLRTLDAEARSRSAKPSHPPPHAACSTASGAATPHAHARPGAPASGSRSRRALSRPTAGASGLRTGPRAARASPSHCRAAPSPHEFSNSSYARKLRVGVDGCSDVGARMGCWT
jgi:signal transduction histidine kinase